MPLVWIGAAIFALIFWGYLLYQLAQKAKSLVSSASELNQAIQRSTAAWSNQLPFVPAVANGSEDIFMLLGQRRKRKRRIDKKKRDRQRRLINRISYIETSERFR